MKYRFNSYDIICAITELQSLIGYRVNQIYDVDHKTYLIRLTGGSDHQKTVILLESGIRFHTTAFQWPKSMVPSGFSMKLRKHLKNKRLERIHQLGVDRIVLFQFGTGEAAYYIIIELYDKGNIVLTDHEFTILHLLWSHSVGEELRYAIREKYPMSRVRVNAPEIPTMDELREMVTVKGQPGENIRGILLNLTCCGPTVVQHVLLKYNLDACFIPLRNEENENTENLNTNLPNKKKNKKANRNMAKGRPFDFDQDLETLMQALKDCHELVEYGRNNVSKGYIVQEKENRPAIDNDKDVEHYYKNIEFISFPFIQFQDKMIVDFNSFMLAVDEFYSKMEGQKIDMKTMQQEREALKKLSNVREDHEKRLDGLLTVQNTDKRKAELIIANQDLVQCVINSMQLAIATQASWKDLETFIQKNNHCTDPVIGTIKGCDLQKNIVIMSLNDDDSDDMASEKDTVNVEEEEEKKQIEQNKKNKRKNQNESKLTQQKGVLVEIDLRLTALGNARSYYDHKRAAAKKVQKTIDASHKALKSAEKKTQQTLKEVKRISSIYKARKVYWFEKFYWFVSSENYLVIGGRDSLQNEMIVKRYMRSNDIYVHAEIQGASSVVIRNHSTDEVPPKTLVEAGTMAISYSVAWDAKVATNAYWVYSHQVSKTAPSGEFLGAGSFMIRGKKNFLPSCQLIMGISLLFKLEESFVEGHLDDRRIRNFDESKAEEEEQIEIENEILETITEKDEHQREESSRKQENISKEMSEDEDSSEENELNDKTKGDESFPLILNEKKYTVTMASAAVTEQEEEKKDYDSVEYPDTEIKIDHGTGKITLHSNNSQNPTTKANIPTTIQRLLSNAPEDETIIISAMPTRQKQQHSSSKKRKDEKKLAKSKRQKAENSEQREDDTENVRIRAQKGKLRKMKEKYKNQSEDEQRFRLQILHKENILQNVPETDEAKKANTEIPDILLKIKEKDAAERRTFQAKQAAEEDDLDDENIAPTGADIELLNSLTGKPFEADELLFVVPVIAPYLALQNYKYKVKLTPGSERRGKATKKVLNLFMNDKQCSTREKDLIKSIKEDLMTRNIPGKVKVAAPQLQKHK